MIEKRPTSTCALLLASALLSTTGLGCARELPPATAVAVAVKTELLPDQVAFVEYRVFRSGANADYATPVSKYRSPVAQLEKPFVITRAVADTFLLSVEGLAPDGETKTVVYRENVTFQKGKTLALPVFLANACYGRRCMFPGQTCYGMSHDTVAAGECEVYPMRELEPIERPGDEAAWDPVPTQRTLLDASFRPRDPFSDDEYDDYDEQYDDDVWPRPGLDGGLSSSSCSTLPANSSCSPNTLSLDASILGSPAQGHASTSTLLDRQ